MATTLLAGGAGVWAVASRSLAVQTMAVAAPNAALLT